MTQAWIAKETAILARIRQLVADRNAALADLAALRAEGVAAQQAFEQEQSRLTRRMATERGELHAEAETVRERVLTRYQQQETDNESERRRAALATQTRYDSSLEAARQTRHDERFETAAVYEASKNGLKARFKEIGRQGVGAKDGIYSRRDEARRLLREYRQPADILDARVSVPATEPALPVNTALAQADARLERLAGLGLARLFKGARALGVYVPIWMLATLALWPKLSWLAPVVAILVAGLLGAGLCAWLYRIARRQIEDECVPLCALLSQAEDSVRRWQRQALGEYRRERALLREKRRVEFRQADEKYRIAVAEAARNRDEITRDLEQRLSCALAEAVHLRDVDLRSIEDKTTRRLADVESHFQTHSPAARQRHLDQVSASRKAHDQARRSLGETWRQGLADIDREVVELNLACDRLFTPWEQVADKGWRPATVAPAVLRVGELSVGPDQAPEAGPKGELPGLTTLRLPALLPFPDQASILWQARGDGRAAALSAVRSVMLRLLATNPPGKVRFTIVDPVGLGQNFAAFMHLADYDEALVGGRIWTETGHIEQRLAHLTEQMETIIQKYLRNEFPSIQAYNAQAGEVAEPLRFLVVANFPANFSETAARRLLSVAASGGRCGVYTLMTIDSSLPLPNGFSLEDLKRHNVVLDWQGDRFAWPNPPSAELPLSLDGPPPDDLFTGVVRKIGESVQNASRVEVPFELIAPPEASWWTGDSRNEISVPLGPAGATRRQHLKLGQGTSQHVLVAGKTGSGKSTLLHALITNVSLLYSPDEIELYLVDFKKGVEFKTYATFDLPHARVVAVESDREFGLSVLQRLDEEMRQRGERYRALGVQNVAAYRRDCPDQPLPRILLIIDEFQEFFVEDDRLAQDVSLLLDRLVRQGRAFGLHVLLGSQTLGGAYSLARSTLGQMAVRIALQCSETDAHLILGEDNSAARLLSRPGEAIYNDGNGAIDANHPFQVAWLSDQRREDYLRRLQKFNEGAGRADARPQIVFEGNVAADLAHNHLLDALLRSETWPEPGRAARAWLGEPVAIKEPTAASFQRQSGHNLLIVGQQAEPATALMASSLLSLAAQEPPVVDRTDGLSASFYLFNGLPAESAQAGILERVAGLLPHEVAQRGWRDVSSSLAEIAAEVQCRQQAGLTGAPALFLLIHDLQRFRDLRKSEDDFSFSRSAEPKANPAQQLGTILREGPVVGVHTLVWCDSWNNVQRTFDRQTLREFELRVLFQMSAADSSSLVDSPVASRLGFHRALFASEEAGTADKFRPYGLPGDDWLGWVQRQLQARLSADLR